MSLLPGLTFVGQGQESSSQASGFYAGDLLHSACVRGFPSVKKNHPAAQGLDFFHAVAGHQHSSPFACKASDVFVKLVRRPRVQAIRRFVEEQQLGIMQSRSGQIEPLLITFGKLTCRPVGKGCETIAGEMSFEIDGVTVKLRKEGQISTNAQAVVVSGA